VKVYAGNTANAHENEMIELGSEIVRYMKSIHSVRKDLDAIPSPMQHTNNLAGFIETNEVDLEQGKLVRCHLINVDSAKNFSVVPVCYAEKRLHFLNTIHAWHKENRSSLKALFDPIKPVKESRIVGSVCLFSSSHLAGKWNRGIIVQHDSVNKSAIIYAVDHSKSLVMSYERLFALEGDEFLAEPIYVHRCLLEDSKEMQDKFAKYVDLIKSSSSVNGGQEPPLSVNTQFSSPSSSNMAHLSIQNFELYIESLGKDLATLNQNNTLHSRQYLVKILDIRRIRSPFTNVGSPHYSSLINTASKVSTRLRVVQTHQQHIGGDNLSSPMSTTTISGVQTCSKAAMILTNDSLKMNEIENDNMSNIEQALFSGNHSESGSSTMKTLAVVDDEHSNKYNRSKSPQGDEFSYQNDTFTAVIESTHIYQPNQNIPGELNENPNGGDLAAPTMNFSDETCSKPKCNPQRRSSLKDAQGNFFFCHLCKQIHRIKLKFYSIVSLMSSCIISSYLDLNLMK
jgi:hypothetical protein